MLIAFFVLKVRHHTLTNMTDLWVGSYTSNNGKWKDNKKKCKFKILCAWL